MRYKLLIIGFLSSISIMIMIGIYAVNANQQIMISLEKGGKHFKAIATASTEVSSYAKRAEGHLLLYLILHRNADKEKFPERFASLHEQISILDQKLKTSEGRAIVEKIKANTGDILSVGNTLIAYHDKAMDDMCEFEIETYREEIFKLHENFSAIRELGVELAGFEIRLEDDLKAEVFENAARLRFYLLLLITLASGFTMYLGYILCRMIYTLNKEIANRIQVEKEIHLERNKLRDALAEVKVLSGMLPICASCKKVRDDKGYWNQIENYIRDHSEVEFSHGICPECAKKHYPDYYTDE